MYNRFSLFTFLIFSILLQPFSTFASDWSNWLGPNFDGSVEEEIMIPEKQDELPVIWKQPVGKGWSSPVFRDGKVYIHDRTDQNENLTAYEIETGQRQWRFSYRSNYQDSFGMEDGPRSTPAIRQKILVSHGAQGLLLAIETGKGKLIWKRDLVKDFGSPKGFFGRCSSPLIVGNKVIIDVGGKTVGLVAFSLFSGKTLWTGNPYTNDYASVAPIKIEEKILAASFMREGLVIVNTTNGKEIFFESFQSPINASVNAATPLVLNNGIFLSSCYEVGAHFWEFSSANQDVPVMFEKSWHKQNVLDCHYSTPVASGEFLYGFHGRQERGANLRCVRIIDGEVMWTAPPMGTGNLIRAGRQIITLTESGEIVIINADPHGFRLLFRQQILGQGRAHFAYSGGRLFARDNRRLICLKTSDKK